MKNKYIYSILFLLSTSFSCAQSENPPFIENGDDSKIYLQKIGLEMYMLMINGIM